MAGFVEGGSAYWGAKQQAAALGAQADYERQVSEINARQMELEAEDTLKRGASAALKRQVEMNKLEGSQRVALAAGGADLGSEQALTAMQEAEVIGEADIAAIKTNAFRQAWGLESKAEVERTSGIMGQRAKKFAARQTLITGKLGALSGAISGTTDLITLGRGRGGGGGATAAPATPAPSGSGQSFNTNTFSGNQKSFNNWNRSR